MPYHKTMNKCNKCNKCNHCDECCDGCKPARYGKDFFIAPDPFNDSKVDIMVNGALKRTTIPLKETDTKLSTNSADNTLTYSAERHVDTLTGKQLGGIIELGDLSDARIDEGLNGSCYELIYRKYGDCGDGCVTPLDAWSNFNINSDGAKKDYLQYVRGANAYGCPVYLDVPTDLDEYWFAGWKQDGEHKQFGYYQATVGDLPKDALGNYLVMSQDPNTKKPIYGPLPLDCILRNLVGNLGMNVYGTWSVIQATPAFSSTFNNVTGDFSIDWNDWQDDTKSFHIGSGKITGKVNWEANFNTENGHVDYHISSVYFDTASWTVDRGNPFQTNPTLTLKGVAIPGGEETTLINAYSYTADESWSQTLHATIPCDQTISVAPGQTVGPFNFAYIFVDWIGDDEGYLQINFQNKLQGWLGC